MKRKGWWMPIVWLLSCLPLAACAAWTTGESASDVPAELPGPEISVLLSDGGVPYAKEAQENDRYVQELSRLFGHRIRYEWLDNAGWRQQMAMRLALRDVPDIIQTDAVETPFHPNTVQNGIFLELNELLEQYGQHIVDNVPDEVWDNPRIGMNGKIYGIPVRKPVPDTMVVYYRKDWLDRLGMVPPETLDDYLAYFEAIKTNDVNGNGDPDDEIPFIVNESLGKYNLLFFGYYGVFPTSWRVVDGKLFPDIIHPDMMKPLALWRELYVKGYVNKDMFTMKNLDKEKTIHSNRAGMWIHEVQNMTSAWRSSYFAEPNEVRLDVLPGPVSLDGEYRLMPREPGFYRINAISAKSRHPELAMQLLNWAYSDDKDKELFFSFGIEGHNYTMEDGHVRFDPEAEPNKSKKQASYFQVMINPSGDNRMNPLLIELSPQKELMRKGIEVAGRAAYDTPDKNMPALNALLQNPELGDQIGSLFADMFTRVVTGQTPVETAFESFVSEWRASGGDEAIREANDWYASEAGDEKAP